MIHRVISRCWLVAALLIVPLCISANTVKFDLKATYWEWEGDQNPDTLPPTWQTNFHVQVTGGTIPKEYEDHSFESVNLCPYKIIIPHYEIRGATIKEGDIVNVNCSGGLLSGEGDGGEGFTATIEIGSEKTSKEGTSPSASLSYKVEKGVKSFSVYISLDKKHDASSSAWLGRGSVYIKYTVEEVEEAVDNDGNEEEDEDDDDDEWEEDNWAYNQSGFMDYVIPIAVVLAIIGGAAAVQQKKKKKKKKKNPNGNDIGNDGSHYEMRVYKDFGDTISSGSGPQPVYARIVKTPAGGGEEVTDAALTAQITITGDQYLKVSGQHIEDGWMCADVEAPDMEPIPEEGVVTFTLAANEGSYTNHLHFHIEAGKVLFGQDNLTLAAHYDKEVRLPFVVLGMAKDAEIVASIVDGAHNPTDFYSIHVEWNEEKEVHEAVILDLKRDPVKDNGKPGNYIPFYLRVNVYNPGGSKIEGWISLVRYYMGLTFRIGDVKCFYEEQNPQKQKLPVIVGFTQHDKTYVPAETTGHLLLYEFDEEQHKVLIINPVPTAEKWGVRLLDESENDALQAIGLCCDVPSNDSPKGTECVLRCLKGGLKPPMRLSAIITMGTEYNGRKYECETEVLLCSQPYRTFQTEAEEEAARKEDKAFLEKLDKLHNAIERQGLAGTLLPMLKYIERWQRGYEFRYGIDRSCMSHLGQVYNYMINNAYNYTYDVREPALPEEGFFWECTMALARGANEMNEKYGYYIMGFRVLAGFWTYGATEGAFKIYDLASTVGMTIALSEVYVDQGRDGLTKNLTYMAWDMAKMAIIMAAVNKGLNVGLGGLRAKYNPRTSTPVKPGDIKPKTEPKPSKNQFTDTKRTRATKAATEQTARQQKAAREYVNSEEMKARMEGIPDEHLHDAAYEYVSNLTEQQLIDISDFCEVKKLYEKYGMTPSQDFIEFERSFIIKASENPMFKQLLKTLEGDRWVEARKVYNELWYGKKGKNGLCNEIDLEVARILAEDAQKRGIDIKASDIELDGVSGNSQAERDAGLTIDMDRDTRYVYKDSEGNKIAFDEQFTREVYNSVFYEKATGCKKLSQIQVDDFADRHFHTTIENITYHEESLGVDVGTMMSKQFDQPLISPQKVQRTVIYKSTDPYSKAAECFKAAESIVDPQERLQTEVRGVYNEINGNYMTGKDGFRFVTALDDARADINGQKFVSQKLETAFTICDQVDMKAAGDTMTIKQKINSVDPRTVKKQLKTIGYDSYTDMTTDMDHTMGQILQHDYQEASKWQMPNKPPTP